MGKLNPPARVKQRDKVPNHCNGGPQSRYNNKKVGAKRNPAEPPMQIAQLYDYGVNPRNAKKTKKKVHPMPVATKFDPKKVSLAFCYDKLRRRPSKKFCLIFGAFFVHRSLHLVSDIILYHSKNNRS